MNKPEPHLTTCPNGCDAGLRDTGLALPEGVLQECPFCGHWVGQCSTETYLKSNQEWDVDVGTWPSPRDLRRLEHRRKRTVRTIARLIGKDCRQIRLLDVGCSSGAFLQIAADMGVEVEGIEPAAKPAAFGRARGLKIHCGFIEAMRLPEHTFDAVTLFEVIEHLDNPIALLQHCHRVLRPDGVLVIGTGNTDSWTRRVLKNRWDFFDLRRHGGHISFFCPRSMKALARRTGFRVEKISTSSVKFTEKGDLPYPLYRTVKMVSELCNIPARILRKGHQMEIYLVREKSDSARTSS